MNFITDITPARWAELLDGLTSRMEINAGVGRIRGFGNKTQIFINGKALSYQNVSEATYQLYTEVRDLNLLNKVSNSFKKILDLKNDFKTHDSDLDDTSWKARFSNWANRSIFTKILASILVVATLGILGIAWKQGNEINQAIKNIRAEIKSYDELYHFINGIIHDINPPPPGGGNVPQGGNNNGRPVNNGNLVPNNNGNQNPIVDEREAANLHDIVDAADREEREVLALYERENAARKQRAAEAEAAQRRIAAQLANPQPNLADQIQARIEAERRAQLLNPHQAAPNAQPAPAPAVPPKPRQPFVKPPKIYVKAVSKPAKPGDKPTLALPDVMEILDTKVNKKTFFSSKIVQDKIPTANDIDITKLIEWYKEGDKLTTKHFDDSNERTASDMEARFSGAINGLNKLELFLPEKEKIMKNLLKHITWYFQNKEDEIKKLERDGESKARIELLTSNLKTEKHGILVQNLGAAFFHCPDRTTLEFKNIYYELAGTKVNTLENQIALLHLSDRRRLFTATVQTVTLGKDDHIAATMREMEGKFVTPFGMGSPELTANSEYPTYVTRQVPMVDFSKSIKVVYFNYREYPISEADLKTARQLLASVEPDVSTARGHLQGLKKQSPYRDFYIPHIMTALKAICKKKSLLINTENMARIKSIADKQDFNVTDSDLNILYEIFDNIKIISEVNLKLLSDLYSKIFKFSMADNADLVNLKNVFTSGIKTVYEPILDDGQPVMMPTEEAIAQRLDFQYTAEHVIDITMQATKTVVGSNKSGYFTEKLHEWFTKNYEFEFQDELDERGNLISAGILDKDGNWKREAIFVYLRDNGILTYND